MINYNDFNNLDRFCTRYNIEMTIDYYDYNSYYCTDYIIIAFVYRPTNEHWKYRVHKNEISRKLEDWLIKQLTIKFIDKKLDDRLDAFRYSYREAFNTVHGFSRSSSRVVEIKNVIFSGPCTIVQWSDGDKTIVKCENEDFDKEKGLAMAICKKFLGTNKSKSNYYDIFDKWIPEEEEEVKYYTVKEVAALEHVSESTILKDIKLGKLFGAKKENGRWLIPIGKETVL